MSYVLAGHRCAKRAERLGTRKAGVPRLIYVIKENLLPSHSYIILSFSMSPPLIQLPVPSSAVVQSSGFCTKDMSREMIINYSHQLELFQ